MINKMGGCPYYIYYYNIIKNCELRIANYDTISGLKIIVRVPSKAFTIF
jgi:hypothetical protein